MIAVRPNLSALTVEVTTQCSLKCVGCARTIGQEAGVWRDRHMSAELFARVCANLPPLERLTLHGIGEPTLNPEYPTIVSTAAASGKFATIGANTHALSRTPEYFRELIRLGMNELYVSVDSLTQEVADRTRTGTRTDLLRRRLQAFADWSLPVHITVVASRFNLEDITTTLAALNEIGAFPVSIQEYVDLGRPEGRLTEADRLQLRHALTDPLSKWPRLTVSGTLSIGATWAAPEVCADPWTGMGVTVDGYLTPCCMMWDPAPLGYLNLGERSIDDAFQSAEYRNFLSRYLTAAPGFCSGCQKNSRDVTSQFIPLMRHPADRQLTLAG